ncbi:Fis family transcriptional regulator [Photobacterium sp. Hal280]|uniref:Fis family transcriptional regulator n=1 Tax=Photobacterium sp. Hal280 TaxID=3035163 RepID=UPI00301BE75F
MRKTDKKTDNQIRVVLTEVCDHALAAYPGFQWLTHLVDYSHFPGSLKVVCVFDTNANLSHFYDEAGKPVLEALIVKKLATAGIRLNKPSAHIAYDTEENCERENQGKWAHRLG